MRNIGKHNQKSLSALEKANMLNSPTTGNNQLGVIKYSKAVQMLPHEQHLMIHAQVNGKTVVKKTSDVAILCQAEKYAKIYGVEYLNNMIPTRGTSPLQQAYDKASDDELLASIRSKYVQRPSEIMAEEYISLNAARNIEQNVEDYIQSRQQQAKQTSNSEGAE